MWVPAALLLGMPAAATATATATTATAVAFTTATSNTSTTSSTTASAIISSTTTATTTAAASAAAIAAAIDGATASPLMQLENAVKVRPSNRSSLVPCRSCSYSSTDDVPGIHCKKSCKKRATALYHQDNNSTGSLHWN